MRSILSDEARCLLEELASRHALLAFDFDGTLAPIVADRDAAQLRPETRQLLRALSLLHPCAVISGRARGDVSARLRGIPLFAIVGNHGAEAGRGPLDRTRREQLVGWMRSLKQDLSLVPGIDVEDKGFSLAVHYRHVPAPAAARQLVLRATTALEGARVSRGHAVVNVAPGDAPDKGTALLDLVRRAGPRPVLYVGDDRTDEHVFRSASIDVGVRVGRTARSAARWYLATQRALDDLLRAMLSARSRLDGLGGRWEGLARAVGV
jgi:trehalose 6-phosphate phosphatase